MAIDINARVLDAPEVVEALARMSSLEIPRAVRAGVRYAVSPARTTLAQAIGQRYSLSASRIKQDVSQASFRAGGMEAVIRTSRKPITAMQFKPKQVRGGLSMAIFRGERTLIRSGFTQTSKGGKFSGTLPFKPVPGRAYSGDGNRKKPRAGLDAVYGPSIHAIYTGGKWSPALQARTELRVEEALVTGILRELGRIGRGFG
jgi:hypothetical protein